MWNQRTQTQKNCNSNGIFFFSLSMEYPLTPFRRFVWVRPIHYKSYIINLQFCYNSKFRAVNYQRININGFCMATMFRMHNLLPSQMGTMRPHIFCMYLRWHSGKFNFIINNVSLLIKWEWDQYVLHAICSNKWFRFK